MPGPFEAEDVQDDETPAAREHAKRVKEMNGDDSEDVVIEDAEEAPSRSERRRTRGQDRWDERERQLETTNRQLTESQMRIARLEAQVEQSQRREPEDDDKAYNDIWEKRRQLAEDFRASDPKLMTPERQKKYMEEARRLEREQYAAAIAVEARKYVQPREDPQVVALRVKHHDVVSDPTRWQAAQLYYNDRKAKNGGQGSVQLLEESMAYARRFKIDDDPPAPRATDADRARHTGAPRGGSGGKGGPVVVTMTRDQKKMADAAFGHIADDKKRYQHYAKTVINRKSTDDA